MNKNTVGKRQRRCGISLFNRSPLVFRPGCQFCSMPQLMRLVKEAQNGYEWAYKLKFDGYRMHARLNRGDVRLLTHTGLDWTGKHSAIAGALRTLPARQAYLDGKLCGVQPDGVTSFAIQNAAERRCGADLVYSSSICCTLTAAT